MDDCEIAEAASFPVIVPEAAAVHDFHLYGLDLMKEGLRYDKAKVFSSRDDLCKCTRFVALLYTLNDC